MVSLKDRGLAIMRAAKQVKAQASRPSPGRSRGPVRSTPVAPPGGTSFDPLASMVQQGSGEAAKLKSVVKPEPRAITRADPSRLRGNRLGSVRSQPVSQVGPGVPLPPGQGDSYDVVRTTKIGRMTLYKYDQSRVLQHKIRVAGSGRNYDEYLAKVRSQHPAHLAAAYALQGGEGVGPWGIVPTMGVDLALASRKPGIAGGSEWEEKLIRFKHEYQGRPGGAPNVGRVVVLNPAAQMFAGGLIVKGAAKAAKPVIRAVVGPGVRVVGRGAPRAVAQVSRRFPVLRGVRGRLDAATARVSGLGARDLAGSAGDYTGYRFSQTPVGRNLLNWARHGYVPASKTTPKILIATSARLGPRTEYVTRTIRYTPRREYGFAVREFVSPKTAARYNRLIGSTTKEISVIGRGQAGRNPWYQLTRTVERNAYRRSRIPGRGVTQNYGMAQSDIRYSSRAASGSQTAYPPEFTTLGDGVIVKAKPRPIRKSLSDFIRSKEGSSPILKTISRRSGRTGLIEGRGYSRAAGRETGELLIPGRGLGMLPDIMTMLAMRGAMQSQARRRSQGDISIPSQTVDVRSGVATVQDQVHDTPPPPPPPELIHDTPPPPRPVPVTGGGGARSIERGIPIPPIARFGGRIDQARGHGPGGYNLYYDENAAASDLLRRLM